MSAPTHPAHEKGCAWYDGQPCNCGGPEYPIHVTLPPVRVQGFDRLFAKLETAWTDRKAQKEQGR